MAEDVLSLIDQRIEEGQRLEYKSELNLKTKTERAEAAKDASGMANAVGGLLIYGVEEEELPDGRRLPTGATPLSKGDAQARLEDVLHSTIAPPVNLIAVTLDAPGGGYFVVVRIEQRAGPLHMVEGYGQQRYFIRTGVSTRPMQAHEVERAFRELGHADERLTALVETLPLVPRIDPRRTREGDRDAGRAPDVALWVSVITAPMDGPPVLLSMRSPTRQDFPITEASTIGAYPKHVHGPLFQIDAHGYTEEDRETDGVLIHRVRLYREGVFEWGVHYRGRGTQAPLYSMTFIEEAHDALAYFASVYRQAEYFGRLRVWIRVDNADQAQLIPERDMTLSVAASLQTADRSVEYTEDTNVERLLDDPMPLVHGAMDLIWQAYGFPRCFHFEDGRYVGGR